jgi:hypothetical protein
MTKRELLSDFASEAVTAVTRGPGKRYLTHAGLVGEDGSRYHLVMSGPGAGKTRHKAEIGL